MKKKFAAKVTKELLESTARLDETLGFIKANCSDEEFRKYRHAVGVAMGEIYLELLEPLFKEHPSLIPASWDWLRKDLGDHRK